jgi:hypothetical protein
MFRRSIVGRFAVLAVLVFVMDWVLAGLILEGIARPWSFVAANPPFGLLYLWFESHWTGTQYLFNGRPVSDGAALLIVPVIALLQAMCYLPVWSAVSRTIRGRRRIPSPA